MSIQALRGLVTNGSLSLTWILVGDTAAITIQVARDSEFTDTVRTFVIPKVPACTLDVGAGLWYFRAAGMWRGLVEWSGIHGPVFVNSTKPPPPVGKTFFQVLNTQPLTNGVRFNTTSTTPSYTIIEYSKEPKFLCSGTKTRYFEDPSRGYIDCENMDPTHTYHIRLTSTENAKPLPSDSVDTMMEWLVFSGKRTLPFMKPHSSQDLVGRRSDTVILKEANESKNPIRFTSQSDYLKYLIARTRNTGEKVK
jgi:hypothetical protein